MGSATHSRAWSRSLAFSSAERPVAASLQCWWSSSPSSSPRGSRRSARPALPTLTAHRIARGSRGWESWLADWSRRRQDAWSLGTIELGGAIGGGSARSVVVVVVAAREGILREEGRDGGGVVIVVDVWTGRSRRRRRGHSRRRRRRWFARSLSVVILQYAGDWTAIHTLEALEGSVSSVALAFISRLHQLEDKTSRGEHTLITSHRSDPHHLSQSP